MGDGPWNWKIWNRARPSPSPRTSSFWASRSWGRPSPRLATVSTTGTPVAFGLSEGRFKRYNWILTMDFATRASWRQYEESEAHDRMVADNLTGNLAGITSIDYDIGETPDE